MDDTSETRETILVIRLGAMGDILHALPAVASLKLSFPGRRLVWLAAHRWHPLLAGNPSVDRLLAFDRSGPASLLRLRRTLAQLRPELAVDFQGLLQSALAGRLARPARLFGFDRSVAREPLASLLYSDRIHVTGPHRIERNLQLAAAAGAANLGGESWIPPGRAEGSLPSRPFVLASPFAGWNSKQWPIDSYDRLGLALRRDDLAFVLNVPPERARELHSFRYVTLHSSSLDGLIHATRRAVAIVGVDSGPLHLAAALGKPGVALFGPTDPAQTGPFRSPMTVLRSACARTTYKRGSAIEACMTDLSVEQVAEALVRSLAAARV